MALTPRSDDPNRAKLLGEMKKMADSGGEGKGKLKSEWNAGEQPSNPAAKPVENASAKAEAKK